MSGKGILALVATALVVGLVVTEGLPRAQSYFPAQVSSNRWLRVGAIGLVTLGGLWAGFAALRALKLKPLRHGG